MAEIEALCSQLNAKRLTNEQIEMFTQYIKAYGNESELKEELIYLINDYNNLIVAAMKLYDHIQMNVTNKNSINIHYTNDKVHNTELKPNEDLIKMKLTNIILKQIEFTRKNPHIFTTKYTNGDYREFLTNLINYNYSLSTLSSISNDIKKYDNKFKSSGFSSMSPKLMKKKEIETYAFNKSLRQYNNSNNNITEQMIHLSKKPFDSNTNSYGNYFDKKLNSYSQII